MPCWFAVWRPGHPDYDAAALMVAADSRDNAALEIQSHVTLIHKLKSDKALQSGDRANKIGKKITSCYR